METTDPELVSLLAGTAGAGLKADALTGRLSPTAPAAGEVAERQRKDRVQELYNSKPFADGRVVNFTAAMELEKLAPQVAAKARREAGYLDPAEKQAKAEADEQARQQHLQQLSAQGQLEQLKRQAAGRF